MPDVGCLLSGKTPPSLTGLSGSISLHPELQSGATLCTTLVRNSVLTPGAVAKDDSASGNPEIFQLTELSLALCFGLGEECAVSLLPSLPAAQ